MAQFREFPFITNGGFTPKLKQRTAQIASTEALNHFDSSFKNQGFTDTGLRKWKRTEKTRGRTLIETGRLRRSGQKKRVSFRQSVIEYPTVYARPHNEGSDPQPKRQFSGRSRVLDRKTKDAMLVFLKKELFR